MCVETNRRAMVLITGVWYCSYEKTFLRNYVTYLLTYLLTYSMQQSPSLEANRFLASQKISYILWNPKVHYCIHKCPPPVPILSQLDPYPHIPLPEDPSYCYPPIYAWVFQVVSFFRFPHQSPVYASSLLHSRYMPHASHSSRFYHP